MSKYTANIAFAGFTAPKILWMKKNEPENFTERSQRSCCQKITWHTSCPDTFCTDVSGCIRYAAYGRKESAAGQKKCLISAESQKSMLPKLYESYEVVGTLKEDIAKELGLPAEVKVIAGAGDNAAAAVGTGTVGDGRCNISLGTSGTIFISSKNIWSR